ncbi:MAG: topoisomerase, partial [Oscillospiraceae bacterium]|nr:topoisomerase [Oscillospiraceae bacterium]
MRQTGSPPRRFTDTEIEAANDTDLPELLSSLGYHVKRVGRYYTTREMDSLRIKDRRSWWRYSESIGGDAIAFVQHFEGKTFQEAVDFLLAWNGRSR